MKYFLCSFGAIYLGILSECTERVISVSLSQANITETKEQGIFISLPRLFGKADFSAPHGLILKTPVKEKKITLLAPPLDIDAEIPEENIFKIPSAFGGKMLYYRGAGFFRKTDEDRLIFFPDIEKITRDFT